jgi:hypothetical protein
MDIRNLVRSAALLTTSSYSLFFTSLNAADLSYSYIEAHYYINSSFDVENADGIGFTGSYKLTDEFFALGQFEKLEGDKSNIEIQGMGGGIGYI